MNWIIFIYFLFPVSFYFLCPKKRWYEVFYMEIHPKYGAKSAGNRCFRSKREAKACYQRYKKHNQNAYLITRYP